MIGHCKDCAHWREEHTNSWVEECYTFCGKLEHTNDEKSMLGNEASVLATSYDDYRTMGRLMTGPEFGCVGFEPKTNAEPEE